MTVTSIRRDWGVSPCLVRIDTDSSFEDIIQPGWLTLQSSTIRSINNGDFEWKSNDSILVSYPQTLSNGTRLNSLFAISTDFSSLLSTSNNSPIGNVLAHPGGGQANAAQLDIGINTVTVVFTTGDSVKLPDDVAGQEVFVYNAASNACNIYPFSGDSINSLLADAPISLAANSSFLFKG